MSVRLMCVSCDILTSHLDIFHHDSSWWSTRWGGWVWWGRWRTSTRWTSPEWRYPPGLCRLDAHTHTQEMTKWTGLIYSWHRTVVMAAQKEQFHHVSHPQEFFSFRECWKVFHPILTWKTATLEQNIKPEITTLVNEQCSSFACAKSVSNIK